MKKIALIYSLVLMFAFTAIDANAKSWNALPLACLPERAQPWVKGKPEAEQAACHCPPADMCPKTYEEYKDNSKAKMPRGFVMRCCPVIEAPERCPNGSLKKDGVPCEESVVIECPEKYYANLNQSLIADKGKYDAQYKGGDEKVRKFISFDKYGITDRLESMFGWSIRKLPMGKVFGYYWIHSEAFNPEGSSTDGYKKLGNEKTEMYSLNEIIKAYSTADLVWFGYSVALREKLPDNLANTDLIKQYNKKGLDFIQIAKAYDAAANTLIYDIDGEDIGGEDNSLEYVAVEKPAIGLSDNHKEFLKICRSVKGEYVTVENYSLEVTKQGVAKTLSCPYLQCRYVYDSTNESCLEENTQITMADGAKKKIADLKVGDMVMSENGKAAKIKAVNKYQEELRVLYGINGGTPTFTGDHPIKTKSGWKVVTEDATKIMAKHEGFTDKPLAVGDVIVGLDGKEIEVKSIERHANFEPINTYNLKIEGDNSFVAADMVVKGFNKMEMHY